MKKIAEVLISKKFLTAAIAILLAAMFVCEFSARRRVVSAERETYKLGTVVHITAYGSDKKALDAELDAAVNEITRLENLFSVNIASSEISKINSSDRGAGVGAETAAIITEALRIAGETDGAFDPTIEPIVKLWGIATDHPRVPGKGEIEGALPLVDYRRVSVSGGNVSKGAGQKLDLGGIAKGWIADRLSDKLRADGIKSALIDLGGNLSVVGESSERRAWRLGLQRPSSSRGEYFAIIEATDLSVVTSGPYERYFDRDGVRYHHIFDPKTGYPAESDLSSVSIVSKNSADADALCTAFFVMGLEKSVRFLKAHKDISAVLLTKDMKKVYATTNIKDKLTVEDKSMSLEFIGGRGD